MNWVADYQVYFDMFVPQHLMTLIIKQQTAIPISLFL